MDELEPDMGSYYRERAPVYDRVYAYPERQEDLRFLEQYVASAFEAKAVLEIAAGTGYWTQFIAKTAKRVTATDREAEPLSYVSERQLDGKVEVIKADAYTLDFGKVFDAAFAGLWFSHIPVQRVDEFLRSMHGCLAPGSIVILLDNSSSQCERLPISHQDKDGNTYQARELDSGSKQLVLKNLPTEASLKDHTRDFGQFNEYVELDNFWLFQYISY